jgi:hypothetical protein
MVDDGQDDDRRTSGHKSKQSIIKSQLFNIKTLAYYGDRQYFFVIITSKKIF